MIWLNNGVPCAVRSEAEGTFFVMEAVCVLFDLRADSEQTIDHRT